jgi:DNA adenine methylase
MSVMDLLKLDITEDRLPAPIQHPSGKRRLKFLLVKLMPTHATYCEPFCGMASVFLAKPRVEKEILNDLSPDYVRILRFLRNGPEEDWNNLSRREWRPSKERWNKLQESQPKERLDQLYRILYLMRFGYRGTTGPGNYSQASAKERRSGFPPQLFDRRDLYRKRLQDVQILQEDFEIVMKKYDSASTLFFLDPPYFGEIQQHYVGTGPEESSKILVRLFKLLPKLRGNWILTHSMHQGVLNVLQKLGHTRTVMVNEPTGREGESTQQRREIIAANFKLPERLRIIHVSKGEILYEIRLEAIAPDAPISKIPVKEINPDSLRGENDKQLLSIHLRLHQLWGLLRNRNSLDGTSREDIANAHYFIVQEFSRRDFRHSLHDSLDETLSRGPLRKIYVERAKPAWRIFELADLKEIAAFQDLETKVLVDVKWDGERIQIQKQAGKIEIWSDYPRRVDARLPHQVKEAAAMKVDNFRLDSEAIMLDPEAKEALHRTMVTALLNGKFDPTERAKLLHLIVFDCLEFDGEDLRKEPLLERVNKLKEFNETDHIHFITDYLEDDPKKDALGYILPVGDRQFIQVASKLMEK